MDWIDRNSSAPSVRSNTERRSEDETLLQLLTFPKLADKAYQLRIPYNFGKVNRRVF